MMQARRLPTVNQLHAASYEGKFKHAGAETARPQKRDAQTIEPVPSHIVPPRKRPNNQDDPNRPNSSKLTHHSRHYEAQTSNPARRRQLVRKYADVKQEMLAMNYDPSRDVLQTLLNPYEGFEDTNRSPHHPFQTKKSSKQGNVGTRKHSKAKQSSSLQLVESNNVSRNRAPVYAETLQPKDLSLSQVLEQQLDSVTQSSREETKRQPLHLHGVSKRSRDINQSVPNEQMQLALEL